MHVAIPTFLDLSVISRSFNIFVNHVVLCGAARLQTPTEVFEYVYVLRKKNDNKTLRESSIISVVP